MLWEEVELAGFGEAVAHGAATIINAIATGRGAAFGVDLWTKARVRLTDEAGNIEGKILSEPSENPALMREAVREFERVYDPEHQGGE